MNMIYAHGQPVTELENPKHRSEVNGVNEKQKRNICFTHPPPQLERIELKDVKEIRSTHIIRIYYAMQHNIESEAHHLRLYAPLHYVALAK